MLKKNYQGKKLSNTEGVRTYFGYYLEDMPASESKEMRMYIMGMAEAHLDSGYIDIDEFEAIQEKYDHDGAYTEMFDKFLEYTNKLIK